MRFGFGVSNFELVDGQSLTAAHQDMLEQASLADALGFDSVWIAEQHFAPERQCPSRAVHSSGWKACAHVLRVNALFGQPNKVNWGPIGRRKASVESAGVELVRPACRQASLNNDAICSAKTPSPRIRLPN